MVDVIGRPRVALSVARLLVWPELPAVALGVVVVGDVDLRPWPSVASRSACGVALGVVVVACLSLPPWPSVSSSSAMPRAVELVALGVVVVGEP